MATAKKPAAKTKKPQKQTPEPQELLLTELREIYSAENQLARALPRFTKAVETEALRTQFERRLEEDQRLIEALDRAFENMDATPGRKKNVAAEGLIADAQEHVQEIERGPALDAVLIGAVQKTEHYCIAAWGTTRSFAQLMGETEVVKAMERALEEGKRYDEELTRLAEEEVNPAMLATGEDESEEEERETRSSRGKSDGGEARA